MVGSKRRVQALRSRVRGRPRTIPPRRLLLRGGYGQVQDDGVRHERFRVMA